MMYTKTFVCLANSRKTLGRCIAGKVVSPDRTIGAWIRPVSSRPTQELRDRERQCQGGGEPRLFEIFEVPLCKPVPHAHQSENHLINDHHRWTRRGICSFERVRNAVDVVESLWLNGSSSRFSLNDRMRQEAAAKYASSLLLINPQDFEVEVNLEKGEFGDRHRARAHFTFRRQEYRLSITDPVYEQHYLALGEGTYPIEQCLICVSLGEPYHDGYCYKYCAAILQPDTRLG